MIFSLDTIWILDQIVIGEEHLDISLAFVGTLIYVHPKFEWSFLLPRFLQHTITLR